MSTVQKASIAHRNGRDGFHEEEVGLEISVDANGDLLSIVNGLKITSSSSDEDVASSSSKDDETDEIINLKTR